MKTKRQRFGVANKLKKRSLAVTPMCSQTLSKSYTQFVEGCSPVFAKRAKGCTIWDVDGNKYIDYAMALGPVILGYAYPSVNKAAKHYIDKGNVFTLPHESEIELSDIIRDYVPCAEMVRFGKNGSDATSGAVRLARAYTGKDIVACCGYHGWQDWYIGTTAGNKGVPKAVSGLTETFAYNDIESLEKIFKKHKNKIACVIMEPVGIVEPSKDFLKKVKKLTHKHGAVLIFDEIITGFRLSLGGAQEYYGVIPDLACFGKAMANGFSISCVAGKRKIMKSFNDVFFSFTFAGETLSIGAAINTLKNIKKRDVPSFLWKQGQKIKDAYNSFAKENNVSEYTECVGLAPRTVAVFKGSNGQDPLELKSLFQQECIKRGVLFTGGHNVSYSHTDKDIDKTIKIYDQVFKVFSKAVESGNIKKYLKGKPVRPVFRKA